VPSWVTRCLWARPTAKMPTVHVPPDAKAALQEIADAVYKSRKVLIVTGAGISTNSGIPVSPADWQVNVIRFAKPLLIRRKGFSVRAWTLLVDTGGV
jgi:hypothetical protein